MSVSLSHVLAGGCRPGYNPTVCAAPEAEAFEWAGIFSMTDSSHTWSMQQVDGSYADASMRLAMFPTAEPVEATMHSLEEQGSNLLTGTTCVVIEAGESMTPAAGGSCFELHVGSGADSTYTIVTTGISGLAIFAQHVPLEFERDRHYLYDSAGTDIEPVAEEGADPHSHGHGGGETCGCAALEADHPFTLDCTNTAGFLEAEATLNGESCVASEASCSAVVGGVMPCQVAFFMLQAHHDICEHDTLTTAQEDLVHAFEGACLNCIGTRPADSSIRNCEIPTCSDEAPALAAYQTLSAVCTSTSCCGTTELSAAYMLLWEYHEICDHDDVPTYVEGAIHDFETPCASAAECNTPASLA